jgi:integrase/recombinase XerD
MRPMDGEWTNWPLVRAFRQALRTGALEGRLYKPQSVKAYTLALLDLLRFMARGHEEQQLEREPNDLAWESRLQLAADPEAHRNLPSGNRATLVELVLETSADQLRIMLADPERDWCAATAKLKLLALRTFFKWLIAQGVVSANPAQGVKDAEAVAGRQPGRRNRHVLSDGQFDELLGAVRSKNRVLAARDRALLCLLFECGPRIGELDGAVWGDVDFESGAIRVEGNHGERSITLPPRTAQALAVLKETCRQAGVSSAEEKPLFPNKQGDDISARSVRRRLERYSAARLDFVVTPEILRASCSRRLRSQRIPEAQVRAHLGLAAPRRRHRGAGRAQSLGCSV